MGNWKHSEELRTSASALLVLCMYVIHFLVFQPSWSTALSYTSVVPAAWPEKRNCPSGVFASSGYGPPWAVDPYIPSILHVDTSWPFVCILDHSPIAQHWHPFWELGTNQLKETDMVNEVWTEMFPDHVLYIGSLCMYVLQCGMVLQFHRATKTKVFSCWAQ